MDTPTKSILQIGNWLVSVKQTDTLLKGLYTLS